MTEEATPYRLNFKMDQAAYDEMQAAMRDAGKKNVSSFIRTAIGFYAWVKRQEAKGFKLYMAVTDVDEVEVFVP